MSAGFDEILQVESREVVAIRPAAPAHVFASMLTHAARSGDPFVFDSMDRWWACASAGQRLRLVLALARVLPHLDGATGQRLADPRWRHGIGVPLWLATFAVSRRLQRVSRNKNTVLAWTHDWRIWRRWCKSHDAPSFNPSPKQLEAFLVDFAPAHKLSSLQRWGSTLTAMHRAAGLPNPLDNPITLEIWRAANRPSEGQAKGKEKRDAGDRRNLEKRQAYGLTRDLCEQVLAKCDEDDTLIAKRDAAVIAMCYDMLARRSEIGSQALLVSDITFAPDGSATARIRRSKTDQKAKGTDQYLRPDTAQRIRRWLDAAGIEDGALFRSMRGFQSKTGAKSVVFAPALPAESVLDILRRRVAAVDVEIARKISGHSGRVGAAQDLVAAGTPDSVVANVGRWKRVDQVISYTSKQAARRGGMAQLAVKQSTDKP